MIYFCFHWFLNVFLLKKSRDIYVKNIRILNNFKTNKDEVVKFEDERVYNRY